MNFFSDRPTQSETWSLLFDAFWWRSEYRLWSIELGKTQFREHDALKTSRQARLGYEVVMGGSAFGHGTCTLVTRTEAEYKILQRHGRVNIPGMH